MGNFKLKLLFIGYILSFTVSLSIHKQGSNEHSYRVSVHKATKRPVTYKFRIQSKYE